MKFEEWFESQHGPRSTGHLADFSDERLADWIKQGKYAQEEMRRREIWDARFGSALYAWNIGLQDVVEKKLLCKECNAPYPHT